MAALWEVFRFEVRFQWRSPLFLAISGFFFLMTFFAMASESVTIGGGTDALDLNAPYVIMQTHFVFSFIGLFAAVAFVATAITRDYESRTAEMFFTSGVPEWAFVLGRFLGGALFAVCAGAFALLGTLVGSLMPWLDQERVAAFSLSPWVFTLVWVIVPNYFMACAFFYTAAALARSISAAYLAALVFMVAYVVAGYYVEPDQISTAALFDPLGSTAFAETTRYWTVYQRNELLPGGSLLPNRLIWLAVAAVFVGLTVWRYRFRLEPLTLRRRTTKSEPGAQRDPLHLSVRPVFSPAQTVRQFISQLAMDVRGVVRSAPFYVILALGMFNVIGGFLGSIDSRFGTPVYPVTGLMLNVISGSFLFIVLIIVLYYSGELVHRERQHKLAEIIDSTPYRNVSMTLAKVGALWFIIAALLVTIMCTGIAVQLLNGYTNVEPWLYLGSLFGPLGFDFFLIAALAVFVQVLMPNKWFGLLAMVVVFLVMQILPSLDLQHYLYLLGTPPSPYSDMNGYGHYAAPFRWFALYWALFTVLLMALAHVFFLRGTASGWRERLDAARQRFTGSVRLIMAASVAACVLVGSYIYYNTNVLNEYRTDDALEALQADYEKRFSHLEDAPLPQMTDVDAEVDIYPERRSLDSAGTARFVNDDDEAIEQFVLSVNPRLRVHELVVPGASVDDADAAFGHYLVRFDAPLQPGAEGEMRWRMSWLNPGFKNHDINNRVVENGTFVDNTEIMPLPGYDRGRELQDNNVRRKYDLPPVERLPTLGDARYLKVSQMGVSRRTNFRALVSTSADQTAIAPGYLQRDWVDGDRRYFEYEMDEPIWPFLSFVSARYAVAKDRWNDVALEVYYHPPHAFNVARMLEASKQSLAYFTEAFSPYQYRQFRILEFPGYATFAQSFPNTIPYSERIGFVADLRDPKDIDYVFYVTAHELAHQWWAHQVIGARMQGMTLIVETLAQYSALMVMERTYGRNKMRRFLKYELDRYLSARGGELIEELPLVKVENQGYIHYSKGSIALYALKEAIGEEAVNAALRDFIGRYGFREDVYPTSTDLVAAFRAHAGPAHEALIVDLFERITLHDLRVTEAVTQQTGEGFDTLVRISAAKFHADGEGVETEAPMEVHVQVGLYPERTPEHEETLGEDDLPEPIELRRVLIRSGDNAVRFRTASQPWLFA